MKSSPNLVKNLLYYDLSQTNNPQIVSIVTIKYVTKLKVQRKHTLSLKVQIHSGEKIPRTINKTDPGGNPIKQI